jgi:hypothetical protein
MPHVEAIVQELLARHKPTAGARQTRYPRVDLDDIAEVIDARPVSYEEVETIIARLEAEGLTVGEPLTGRDVGIMRSVIVAAHGLTGRLRRRPTVDELSAQTGHPPHVVRRALAQGASARPLRP